MVEIKTRGDRDRHSPLSEIGGTGLFTKEIQRAVQDGLVEIAVHSLKDLPSIEPPDLVLAAVPSREDVADALIAPHHQTIARLPQGGRIGTSSPRRRAQLLRLRPDLDIVTLRGNVETRLNHALMGTLDGVVLAYAGLHRLDLEHHVTQRLEPRSFLPAAGQGALAIECRRDESTIRSLLLALNHETSRQAVTAERAVLAALNGGCSLPIAAWARDFEGRHQPDAGSMLTIDAAVFAPNGSNLVTVSISGPRREPVDLGQCAAEALKAQGAEGLLKTV